MKKLGILAIIVALSLGLLTACGGGGGEVHKVTVDMGVNNELKFDPADLTVKKGDTVELTLVNKDTAQNHTWVVKDLNAKSSQVLPGNEETISFKASKAGQFEIICDVPGHKEGGMKGTLTVTE